MISWLRPGPSYIRGNFMYTYTGCFIDWNNTDYVS